MISSIKSPLIEHDCQRITQGDILRDYPILYINSNREVIELLFPYVVVLSQDCDLEQGLDGFDYCNMGENTTFNQLLPNILLSPAFILEEIKDGVHLESTYNIKNERLNSDKIKKIKQNKDDRYHYISEKLEEQVPNLIIDFKLYFTTSTDLLIKNHKEKYLISLNELYRESLSQRFCNYLNRIGLQ